MQLIDVDEAIRVIGIYDDRMYSIETVSSITDGIKDAVRKIPVREATPVIRCKDCKYRDPEDKKCNCGGLARQGCLFPVADDYFCAYGEREEGEQDG